MMRKLLVPLCFALLWSACTKERQPQEPNPLRRKSPIAIASAFHQPTDTYVKIVYGQPYKRGRDIFGDLVPYGEVWRTGANEATELTTTKPILFNGNRLEAGTYALFTIPREDRWTIILNDSLGQWGAFEYDKKFDHLRTRVIPQTMEQVNEAFTVQFSELKNNSSSIQMRWDSTLVEIPISFTSGDSAGS